MDYCNLYNSLYYIIYILLKYIYIDINDHNYLENYDFYYQLDDKIYFKGFGIDQLFINH